MRETYSFGTYRSISCNFFPHKISLPLSSTGKCKRHAAALWQRQEVFRLVCSRRKWGGKKIRVRLCALRPCVRDKACEAYSPSVSSQSSDSTSLSAQLQLSPRVLRGLRTGQVSANPRGPSAAFAGVIRGKWSEVWNESDSDRCAVFSNCWMLFSCRWCGRCCRFCCCWWWRLVSKLKVTARDKRLCVKWKHLVKRMCVFSRVHCLCAMDRVPYSVYHSVVSFPHNSLYYWLVISVIHQ